MISNFRSPGYKWKDRCMSKKNELVVLIVDDDEAVRDSLTEYLDSIGWKTLTADSGEKALEYIREKKCDIVISDIRMPQMDGIELTRRIKEIDPDIDVIIATGHSTETLAVNALKGRSI